MFYLIRSTIHASGACIEALVEFTRRVFAQPFEKYLVAFKCPVKQHFITEKATINKLAQAKRKLKRDFSRMVLADEVTFHLDNSRLSER